MLEAKGWPLQTNLGSRVPSICCVTLNKPFTAWRFHLTATGWGWHCEDYQCIVNKCLVHNRNLADSSCFQSRTVETVCQEVQ